jgi:ribosomal protein L40E
MVQGVWTTEDRRRSMMKVCINCHAENPVDGAVCSECGASLTRAPTAEEAVKAREEMERARTAIPAAQPEPPPAPEQRMRRIARILALTRAGWWTLFIIALVFWLYMCTAYGATIAARDRPSLTKMTPLGSGFCGVLPVLLLIPWVTTAIAWRREGVGGVVLVLEGLLAFFVLPIVFAPPHGLFGFEPGAWPEPGYASLPCTLPIALPSLLIGILFLTSWWRSRTLGNSSKRELQRD